MRSSAITTFAVSLAAFAACSAPAAHAQSALEQGFSGALRGCEEWILNPESWIDGLAPFMSTVGLGDRMGLVPQVDEASLPPPPLRGGNHYWRINSTETAGYVLVVSDQMPMCHITGGGNVDLQPIVEAVLASAEFARHWEKFERTDQGDMAMTSFRNRTDPSLSAVISRANRPGGRFDRVQVVVTAKYETQNQEAL